MDKMNKYYKTQKATFICNGQIVENGIIYGVTNYNPLFEEPSYDLVVKTEEPEHLYKQIKESDILEITGNGDLS